MKNKTTTIWGQLAGCPLLCGATLAKIALPDLSPIQARAALIRFNKESGKYRKIKPQEQHRLRLAFLSAIGALKDLRKHGQVNTALREALSIVNETEVAASVFPDLTRQRACQKVKNRNRHSKLRRGFKGKECQAAIDAVAPLMSLLEKAIGADNWNIPEVSL